MHPPGAHTIWLKYTKNHGTGNYLAKNAMMMGLNQKIYASKNMMPTTWTVTDAATNHYAIPMMGTTSVTWIDNPIMSYMTVAMSSVDYVDYSEGNSGAYSVMTAKGFKITIRPDGSYEIEAPNKLDVGDLVRMRPGAKLIDKFGRVLMLRPDDTFSVETLVNASHNVIDIRDPTKRLKDSLAFSEFNRIVVPESGCKLVLPNDVLLDVDDTGHIKVIDADKKVFYEAAPRPFNKYLNVSDVLEDFIRYLGTHRVKQRHVMQMPMGLLLNWLVIEAATADGETADDLKPTLYEGVANLKAQPRCLYCKRFIARARFEKGITFCSGGHMDRYAAREDLVQIPRRRPVPVIAPPSETYFDRAA